MMHLLLMICTTFYKKWIRPMKKRTRHIGKSVHLHLTHQDTLFNLERKKSRQYKQ